MAANDDDRSDPDYLTLRRGLYAHSNAGIDAARVNKPRRYRDLPVSFSTE
jgi:hypothetical protein